MRNNRSKKRAQEKARRRQARKRQRLENERFQSLCHMLDPEPDPVTKKAKTEPIEPAPDTEVIRQPMAPEDPTPEPAATKLPQPRNVSLNTAIVERLLDFYLPPITGSGLYGHTNPLLDRLYDMQPLTAVCQSWRQAILPLFYESVIYHISTLPLQSRQSANDRPRHAIRSNAGLISSNGYMHFTQKLLICLVGNVRPDLPVTVLNSDGFDSPAWPNITHLGMAHRHTAGSPKYARDSVSRFNAFLLHALPNLKSIAYTSSGDQMHYAAFPLDGLLGSTLGQLTGVSVISGLTPALSTTSFLPKLTRLAIRCPMLSGATNLPMIFSETLVTLHLCFTSAETIWERFYASNTGKVVFTQLESLVLEYTEPVGETDEEQHRAPSLFVECMDEDEFCESADDDSVAVTGKQIRPIFHKLQHLSVLKYPHSIMQILRYFDLGQIPYVSLRDVSDGYDGLRASDISAMESLRVHISEPITESSRFRCWLNCLFSVTSSMSSLHLQASVQVPVTLPDIIGLCSLTSVSLSMPVDIGCLPNLLSRLPHLRRLSIYLHPISSTWSDRSPVMQDSQLLPYLPTLSRSLTNLVVYVAEVDSAKSTSCDGWDVERELVLAIARVPSLLVLTSEAWTCETIRNRIQELLHGEAVAAAAVAQFGHLENLNMSVWRY